MLGPMKTCECGCGAEVRARYVSGHNLAGMVKTEEHRKRISEGQRRAWKTKRKRMPVGSTWIDAGGYVREKVTVGAGPWRLQHHLVMEREIGRRVKKGEVVHHINGDRKDNSPENLYLCRSHSHHNDVHRTQDVALRECLAAGVVRFTEGRYEAVLR